jgi:hypothetical protein
MARSILAAVVPLLLAMASLPGPALASGAGAEVCPRGLHPLKLEVSSPTEMNQATVPLQELEGIVPIPAHTDGNEDKPVYDYVWSTFDEAGGTGGVLLCGIKPATSLSESAWLGIVVGAFVVGFALAIGLILLPRRPTSHRLTQNG